MRYGFNGCIRIFLILPLKVQPLAFACVVELSVMIGQMSIYKRVGDVGVEWLPLKRRPSALVMNVVFAYDVRRIWVNHNQVGVIPFADETALFDAEQAGGGMAHAFCRELGREKVPAA